MIQCPNLNLVIEAIRPQSVAYYIRSKEKSRLWKCLGDEPPHCHMFVTLQYRHKFWYCIRTFMKTVRIEINCAHGWNMHDHRQRFATIVTMCMLMVRPHGFWVTNRLCITIQWRKVLRYKRCTSIRAFFMLFGRLTVHKSSLFVISRKLFLISLFLDINIEVF